MVEYSKSLKSVAENVLKTSVMVMCLMKRLE